MEIGRARESREAMDRAFINLLFRFADCFALRAGNNEGSGRVAGPCHFNKAVVMSVVPGQFDVKVGAVWTRADGLRRDDNIFRESGHGRAY